MQRYPAGSSRFYCRKTLGLGGRGGARYDRITSARYARLRAPSWKRVLQRLPEPFEPLRRKRPRASCARPGWSSWNGYLPLRLLLMPLLSDFTSPSSVRIPRRSRPSGSLTMALSPDTMLPGTMLLPAPLFGER